MQAATDGFISVLAGPTCSTCESDDLRWRAPAGALGRSQCPDCRTEYRLYAVAAPETPCPSCGSWYHHDEAGSPFCEDCELSDCAYCGTSLHRFELSENLACPICEHGEVAA